MSKRLVTAVAIATLAVAAIASGCGGGGGGGPTLGTFVGKVEGTDAFIVLIAAPGTREQAFVSAYVCDGKNAIARRFRPQTVGTLEGTGGGTLTVELEEGKATGTVSLPGREPADFSAELAKGEAGWYYAVEQKGAQDVRYGWVVLNNGEQRGAQVTGTQVTAAPQLSPSTGTAGAILARAAQPFIIKSLD